MLSEKNAVYKNIKTIMLKIKEWKKVYYANTDHKKASVAIWISDKAVSEQRILAVNEGHFIMITGSVHYGIHHYKN